eukprot:COSAG02_NODE_9876_length_2085_cov_1.693353_1_plen_338_part_00
MSIYAESNGGTTTTPADSTPGQLQESLCDEGTLGMTGGKFDLTVDRRHAVILAVVVVVIIGLIWHSVGSSTPAPLDAAQVQRVEHVTCYEVGCGQRGECGEDTYCAFPDESHEVSCCSDVDLGNWNSCFVHGRTVYGERDASGLTCTSGASLAEAESLCAGVGARLCSLEELEADCTAETGCSHDWDLVWSSDSCIGASCRPGIDPRELSTCNLVGCGQLGECGEEGFCAFPFEKHSVGCCSDVDLGGWRQCYVSGRTVYGERNAGALSCTHGVILEDAVAVCASVGARLCTLEELEADCTADTGCSFDYQTVWSSTPGDPRVRAEVLLRGQDQGQG